MVWITVMTQLHWRHQWCLVRPWGVVARLVMFALCLELSGRIGRIRDRSRCVGGVTCRFASTKQQEASHDPYGKGNWYTDTEPDFGSHGEAVR